MAIPGTFLFGKNSLFTPEKPEVKHRQEIDADLNRLFMMTRFFVNGGEPGGSNTHVQFNNNGAFGGDSGFTYISGTSVTIRGGYKFIFDNDLSSDSYIVYTPSNQYLEFYLDGELRVQM